MALPPGLYLIGCRPVARELSFETMRSTLGELPELVAR